jgi:hypothetical protein
MGDLVDKFLDTIALLFDPFLVILAAICAGLGFAARHRIQSFATRNRIRFVLCLILSGLSVLGFFLWMQFFVFPYPPNSSPPAKWIIAGMRYTPAAAELATDPRYQRYSLSRRNSELVYASGGDAENVWTGASIEAVEYLGKAIVLALAFIIGSLPRVNAGRGSKEG